MYVGEEESIEGALIPAQTKGFGPCALMGVEILYVLTIF
jgi:hypothetical protein